MTIRVNVRAAVNKAAIRKEVLNGRDVIIVPSATLPDNVIMNGSGGKIMYPADEIEKGYRTLERTPAPFGHPTINGKFVSASDPEGINIGWIGAWNQNVRRENGRVLIDKVIDVERAKESANGRATLEAIEKGDPIHTSTALYFEPEPATNTEYKMIARNMVFDHDAILLNEQGAATPEQGVGMLVNSKGEEQEIEVFNSEVDTAEELEWAAQSAIRALENQRRDPSLVERVKSAITAAFLGSERETSTNRKEDIVMDQKQFDELSAKVTALSESLGTVTETLNTAAESITALKAAQDELKANQEAKDKAELAGLRETIVNANLLDEESAGELTLNAARKLAEKAKPGTAAPIVGAFNGAAGEPTFKLPEGD